LSGFRDGLSHNHRSENHEIKFIGCSLCGKNLNENKDLEVETTIDGIRYVFDTPNCMSMFMRLKSVYGDKIVESFFGEQYISDPFWNKVIPNEQEIMEIEKQKRSREKHIQILENPSEIQEFGSNLVKSAVNEILLIFSTANAFHRQIRLGGLKLLDQTKTAHKGISMRILTPFDGEIERIAKNLREESIYVRNIEESLQIKFTILIVDRKSALCVELKDDTKQSAYDAMGLATYYTSKASVLSFSTIFESIWKQEELHEHLSELQKEISIQKKAKMHLINSVMEMRNSVRSILELAKTIHSNNNTGLRKQEDFFFNMIVENANKLEQLTDEISKKE
jgi:two-component system, OmpR family, sensor histidine kinase VicK